MRSTVLLFVFSCIISFSIAQYELNLDWLSYPQSSQGDNFIASMETDSEGNTYSIGGFAGSFDVDPGPLQSVFSSRGFNDIFIQKYDLNGAFLWAKQIGGAFEDAAVALAVDDLDNVYITGFFTGNVDFDPGPGVFNMVNPRSVQLITETFLLKLDKAGDFVWAKRMGGNYYAYSSDITITSEQNIYLAGSFRDTVDFDPGPGNGELVANGIQLFLTKYDTAGNYQWASMYGAGNFRQEIFIDNDPIGNVYLAGNSLITNDLDPSPGNLHAGTQYGDATFMCKLDPKDSLLWVRTFEADNLSGFTLDNSDQVLMTGTFTGDVDFDPSGKFFFRRSEPLTQPSVFISKFSVYGNHRWTEVIGGSGRITSTGIDVDEADNVYVTGNFESGDDLDPSSEVAMPFPALNPPNGPRIRRRGFYCIKLDASGNFGWPTFWEQTLRWSGSEMGDIKVLKNDHLLLAGEFVDSVDFDLGPGAINFDSLGGNQKYFLMNLGTDSCSGFGAVIDSTSDFNCESQGYARADIIGGTAPFMYSWNYPGSPNALTWDSIPGPGFWNFSVKDTSQCIRRSSLVLRGPVANQNVRVTSEVVFNNPFQPGRLTRFAGIIQNDGCDTTSGTLACIFLDKASFFSSNPPHSRISGDTAFIDVPILEFGQPFRYTCTAITDTNATRWDSVKLDLVMFPTVGDTATGGSGAGGTGGGWRPQGVRPPPRSRNTTSSDTVINEPVQNSRDPNDISVEPKGACEAGYITEGQELTYKIRFQNNGNAPAIDIAVLDTLSPYLNLDSLDIIASSHDPMVTEILPGNILRFFFKDIYLPDSTTNEEESQGYIIFSIAPKPNIVPPAEITNRVGIYFDFNAPIITNTVLNTITDIIPQPDTVMVDTLACRSMFSPRGIRIDTSGRYIETISSDAGCDSIVILDVAIQYQDTSVYQAGASAFATLSGVTYQWINCDNETIIPGATSQQFIPVQNGNYAVILSNRSCLDTSECVAITSVGFGQNDFGADLSIYPNPTSGKVNVISSENIQQLDIEIFNLMGKRLLSKTIIHNNSASIDIPGPQGMYIIRLQNRGKKAVYKIVKE